MAAERQGEEMQELNPLDSPPPPPPPPCPSCCCPCFFCLRRCRLRWFLLVVLLEPLLTLLVVERGGRGGGGGWVIRPPLPRPPPPPPPPPPPRSGLGGMGWAWRSLGPRAPFGLPRAALGGLGVCAPVCVWGGWVGRGCDVIVMESYLAISGQGKDLGEKKGRGVQRERESAIAALHLDVPGWVGGVGVGWARHMILSCGVIG